MRALNVNENDDGGELAINVPCGLKQMNFISVFTPFVTVTSHSLKSMGAVVSVEKPTSTLPLPTLVTVIV